MSTLLSAIESYYIYNDYDAVNKFFRRFNHPLNLTKILGRTFYNQVIECCKGECGVIHKEDDCKRKLKIQCAFNALLKVVNKIKKNFYNTSKSSYHCKHCINTLNKINALIKSENVYK